MRGDARLFTHSVWVLLLLLFFLLQRQTTLIAQAATGNLQLSDEEAKALNRALIPRVQFALQNGDREQLDAIVRSEDAIACRQLTITESSASFANVEIESGDTPLILAVKHFDMQLLNKYASDDPRALNEHLASPNAATAGRASCVAPSCIQCGADVNFQTKRGHTALAWACVTGNLDAFKTIVMKGAKVLKLGNKALTGRL